MAPTSRLFAAFTQNVMLLCRVRPDGFPAHAEGASNICSRFGYDPLRLPRVDQSERRRGDVIRVNQ